MARRITGILTGIALGALVLLVLITVALPRVLGGNSLTILTGSMEPGIRPGDVVAVVPVDAASLRTGDIITFQPISDDPTLITHRIVAVRGTGAGISFVTRGDANTADDPPIIGDQVMGRVLYVVPFVGWANTLLGRFLPVVVFLLATVLILGGITALLRPRFHRKARS